MVQQLTLLEETYRKFADIGWRKDEERKRDLVETRRNLSEQLLDLERYVTDVSAPLMEASLKREFGARLSKLRSEIAYHQATWPAVRLEEEPAEYRRATQQVEATFRDFIQWGGRSLPRDADSHQRFV
ncbi:MAG: hypothetical protein R3E04_06945 [Sphingobium sp.]